MDLAGRPDPPSDGDEAATLLGFLDFQRATLRWKTDGLDAAQLAAPIATSTMTLGGLLKHMAYNENAWFGQRVFGEAPGDPWDTVDWAADPDWDWHSAAHDTPEQLQALLEREVQRSRAVLDRVLATADLGRSAHHSLSDGRPLSVRWIVTHMIEEYARHNGHADVLREAIDGATGE